MIDVSVIIPVYNAEAHLEECLSSVCRQTLNSIEIICVDDGSTDGSGDILKRISEDDPRVKIVRQKNGGAGTARNTGLRLAEGRYLSFLDSDDFFEPTMLEKAVRLADRERSDVVVFGADRYHEDTGKYSPADYALKEAMLPPRRPFAGVEIERNIFDTVIGWAWDKLFRTEYIRANNLTFQEQRTTNDLYFVYSAFARAERISTLPEVLAHYRMEQGASLSVTREKSWMCFYDALIALRDQLRAWGLYDRFEVDYINYALHFTLWNFNTLKEPTRKKLFMKLRSDWFRELGIAGLPGEQFYDFEEYRQYEWMAKFPYWMNAGSMKYLRHLGNPKWVLRKIRELARR